MATEKETDPQASILGDAPRVAAYNIRGNSHKITAYTIIPVVLNPTNQPTTHTYMMYEYNTKYIDMYVTAAQIEEEKGAKLRTKLPSDYGRPPRAQGAHHAVSKGETTPANSSVSP